MTQRLGPRTYLFAVANGFGSVCGEAAAPAALGRLHDEIERRSRGDRWRAGHFRSRALADALSGALARVNEELHARSASHDDYVTAASSLTAVLLVEERAYLAHIGSTAAYLARDGSVVSLTKHDVFESESGLPVLTRALGIQPSIDIASCCFTLTDGDALVLARKRLREGEEGRRLAECLEYGAQSEQLLILRYAADDPDAQVPAIRETQTVPSIVTGILATITFYALLCIR